MARAGRPLKLDPYLPLKPFMDYAREDNLGTDEEPKTGLLEVCRQAGVESGYQSIRDWLDGRNDRKRSLVPRPLPDVYAVPLMRFLYKRYGRKPPRQWTPKPGTEPPEEFHCRGVRHWVECNLQMPEPLDKLIDPRRAGNLP
jgi:hypothetical protein